MRIAHFLCLAVFFLCIGCREKKAASGPVNKSAEPSSHQTCPTPHAKTQQAGKGFSGVAEEIIDAAGYTYVLINTGKEKVWAAAPKTDVQPGQTVTVSDTMAMHNFTSKTLKRTFPLVYFAGSIQRQGEPVKGAAATCPMAVGGFSGSEKSVAKAKN